MNAHRPAAIKISCFPLLFPIFLSLHTDEGERVKGVRLVATHQIPQHTALAIHHTKANPAILAFQISNFWFGPWLLVG